MEVKKIDYANIEQSILEKDLETIKRTIEDELNVIELLIRQSEMEVIKNELNIQKNIWFQTIKRERRRNSFEFLIGRCSGLLEALEKEITKSFVIIESKVKDIIHEKENKNLPVSSGISKKEFIEIETYRFLSKYGYDRSDEYAKDEAVYTDTTASEISRIIEYINTSKVIDV